MAGDFPGHFRLGGFAHCDRGVAEPGQRRTPWNWNNSNRKRSSQNQLSARGSAFNVQTMLRIGNVAAATNDQE
jgi:hypothetical protein